MINRSNPRRNIDYNEALTRCAALCERCEQCTPDLLEKMKRWGTGTADARKVIERLEELRFVDDERFARAYAHDKVCFSGWGRYKVIRYLLAKRLPRETVAQAMDGVEEDEYSESLRRVIASKVRQTGTLYPDYESKMKIVRHAMQRGFEGKLAVAALREILGKLQAEAEADEEE